MSTHRQRRFTEPPLPERPNTVDRDKNRPAILRSCPHCDRSIGPMLATELNCPYRPGRGESDGQAVAMVGGGSDFFGGVGSFPTTIPPAEIIEAPPPAATASTSFFSLPEAKNARDRPVQRVSGT